MGAVMTFLRRVWVWLAAALLVAAAVFGVSRYREYQAEQARQAAQAALRTEVIGRGSLVARVSATGSVLAEQETRLFFSIPGTVAEVLVESGDTVRAGQVLARLDTAELGLAAQQAADALAMAELNRQKLHDAPSEADVAVAQANLRAAHAKAGDLYAGAGEQEVAIAQLKYDSALADYQALADQYNNLVQFAKDHPNLAPAQDQLDTLKGSMEQAYYAAEIARLQLQQLQPGGNKAELAVAYAQVAQAQAVLSQTLAGPTDLQLVQADLSVEQAETAVAQAQLRLDEAQLVAPYDGVIATVALRPGEPAVAGAPVIVLLDPSRFHLDVAVDEVDVARLAVGQPVTVVVDALPNVPLTGRVDRLAPTASINNGIVNFAVRLVLDPTEAPLRAGMSATADIVVAEAHDVVLVPNWAIRRDRRSGQAYASVMVGDSLAEVPITTGLRGETHTEVVSGVDAGAVAAISTERDGLDLLGGS